MDEGGPVVTGASGNVATTVSGPQEGRAPENTTPTLLEEWASEVFAPAYRAAG